MEITIDLKLWEKSKVLLEEFVLLCAIYNDNKIDNEFMVTWNRALSTPYHTVLQSLKDKEMVIEDEIGVHLRAQSLKLFNTTSKIDFDKLTKEYRSIFPPGSDTYGRYRGDKQGCKSKLKTFFRENKKVTPQQVLQATQKYVNRYSPTWEGMTRAHYFIKKNNISLLAAEIEALDEKEAPDNNPTTTYIG